MDLVYLQITNIFDFIFTQLDFNSNASNFASDSALTTSQWMFDACLYVIV